MADDQLFHRFGKEFPAGTVLFREGEPGREMYVVQQGKVTISKRVGDVEKILSSLGPGEFLGEMSILNNKPRSATATCADRSRLLVIDAKTFETMVRSSAEIAIRMIKKLADRLQEANEQIENLLLADASARVAHFLVHAAERGQRTAGGQRIDVPPKELAARVGVKADQADDVLVRLVASRLVVMLEDGFVVPDASKLREFLQAVQTKSYFGDVS